MSDGSRDGIRSGESWDEFLTNYKITGITATNSGWEVRSQSGNTYTVTERTQIDEMGSMYFTIDCTCPARGRCRHIDAVEQMRVAEAAAAGDYDALDKLERIEC